MRFLSGLLAVASLHIAAPATAQAPASHDPFAVRLEGYLGGAVVDNGGRTSAFDGGGAGSAVGLLGPGFLQLDLFGDYTDFGPDITDVGFGGHLGLVDAQLGSVALTGGYQHFEAGPVDLELWRIGGEGELYLDMFTLGVQAGYLRNGDTEADGGYARALIRIYPTDQLKLEGIGGYAELGTDAGVARLLAEYRLAGLGISLFARWEGTFMSSADSHAAVAGVRYYWDRDLSLREAERVYFRDACTHLNVAARIC